MKILLVEDDRKIRTYMLKFLRRLGHEVTEYSNGKEALEAYTSDEYALVLSDIKMPGMSGLEILRTITGRSKQKQADVILFTGYGDIVSAIEALRAGAFDYLLKPVNPEELVNVIDRVAEHQAQKHRQKSGHPLGAAGKTSGSEHDFSRMQKILAQAMGIDNVGFFSDSMRKIIRLATAYHENRNLPVLIEGETGTGKELIARTIHYGAMWEESPFIDINCATIPAHLFESELFGYEGGAFTGASSHGHKGKLDLAKGGTLFLDEISEIPVELQAKLLRVIQEKEFYRVGGLQKIKTDLRIICATNVSLIKCVERGTFRKDLYYRLKVGHVFIPPLRDRQEEIVLLATMFLQEYAAKKGKKFEAITEGAKRILSAHNWPGNVRELRNLMELVVALYDDEELKTVHLSMLDGVYEEEKKENEENEENEENVLQPYRFALPKEGFSLQKYVDRIIFQAVEMHNGNKAVTARYLKCSRRTIYHRLQKSTEIVQ